jgi:hypothetical protein
VFGLNPVAYITSDYMTCNILLHVLPPEHLSHIGIHLSTTRMDAILRVMHFCQDLLMNHLIRWYIDSVIAPTHSSFIYSELRVLTSFHPFTKLQDLRAFLLSLTNAVHYILLHSQFIQHALGYDLEAKFTHFLT